MISPKFYSQISICQYCKGWGIKNYPTDKKRETCTQCAGRGVYFPQSGYIHVWDAPAFINYKGRKKVIILKILAISLVISFVILFCVLVKNFISYVI